MVRDGVKNFYEVGTDDTLQKIVSRMYPDLLVSTVWETPEYATINPF